MSVRRKILVIDDDPVIREILKSVLEKADYEVILADNGMSGLEAARRDEPDLVITDGLLPKLHGFLVCKQIKEFESPPKVIILTGLYTKPTYKWDVKRDYNADDLLGKPIEPEALIKCVKKHLADLATFESAYASPSELSAREAQFDRRPVPAAAPKVETGFSFTEAEMEEIFNDWAVPCY